MKETPLSLALLGVSKGGEPSLCLVLWASAARTGLLAWSWDQADQNPGPAGGNPSG